jgi:nucleoside-diphosphate-sugar epimerase
MVTFLSQTQLPNQLQNVFTMKIAITGGSGFIGSNLVRFYLEKGYQVLNLDVNPPSDSASHPYWIKCDIMDAGTTQDILLRFDPQYVIHMAARTDLRATHIEDYAINMGGVATVLNIAHSIRGLKKIIFASSMLVCEAGYIPEDDLDYCPSNLYGQSKVAGERLVREQENLGLNWVIVRPTSIWGPGFGPPYRSFFEAILQGRYVNFAGCENPKTYGYIGNIVEQIDAILHSDTTDHNTYYLGDYEPLNIRDWSNEIAAQLNLRIPTVPKFFIVLLAKLGDVLESVGLRFPLTSFRLKNITIRWVLPLENTQSVAPRVVYTRSDGIRETLRWLKIKS